MTAVWSGVVGRGLQKQTHGPLLGECRGKNVVSHGGGGASGQSRICGEGALLVLCGLELDSESFFPRKRATGGPKEPHFLHDRCAGALERVAA